MKISIDKMKKFLSNNWKYLAGAVAFIILVIILVNLSAKEGVVDEPTTEETGEATPTGEETKEEGKEEVEQANSLSTEETKINELINQYFNAMANNDVETLKAILGEVLPEDEESVKKGSEYTESYNNVICYTRAGQVENSYVVFASYEAKFVGINTTAPGLLSFYVLTKEDGSLYIQNKLDDETKTYIQGLVVDDEEVANLFEASQKRYEQALADDTALKDFVASLENQSGQTTAENNAEQVQATETPQPTEAPQVTETPQPTEAPAENATVYVKAKENVNVRNDASEDADPIGKLLGGETAEKTGEKDGWICINYKGQPGYVKADFVETTTDGSGSVSQPTSNEDSENNESSKKETVYVKETVNIREGMSQDSKRVGTAYAGDTYTKIQDYAEGWTKIEYNGSEAYIKTEFLETR